VRIRSRLSLSTKYNFWNRAWLSWQHDPSKPILAAFNWRTNGLMIADAIKMFCVYDGTKSAVDLTFGDGKWWTEADREAAFAKFVIHDKYKYDGVDYERLPEADETYDYVFFDPPYVSKGGRSTSTIGKMDAAYGIGGTSAPSPQALQDSINKGLSEAFRVLKPEGICFVKVMDYVSSGHVWWGHFNTHVAAKLCGFLVDDRLIHVGRPGPQPQGRKQKHARNNFSVLLVLRKPSK
jgi:hypothetical protein